MRPTFDEIWAECGPFVWRVLRRLGVDHADLEDVCQEVALVIFRRLETFDGQCAVRTWVYSIAIRVAWGYRRRAHRGREQVMDEMPSVPVPAEQDDVLERQRALAWLDRVLEKVDAPKRAVFVLHYVEELPMAEIAVIVGCPVQTGYARLRAAEKYVEAAARRERGR
jgi:RNA polymerase sigma-70 factor (ECF subfamily)